jgi:hypothetical protein
LRASGQYTRDPPPQANEPWSSLSVEETSKGGGLGIMHIKVELLVVRGLVQESYALPSESWRPEIWALPMSDVV